MSFSKNVNFMIEPSYYKNIEGWFDWENLYSDLLLNKLPDYSTIVEIGVWKGKSLCYLSELALLNNKIVKIYGVDIFSNELDNLNKPYCPDKNMASPIYFECLVHLKNIGALGSVAVPLVMFSNIASFLFNNNSIDCVFIDGSHDEQSVIQDLDYWVPKVKVGGYVCGHDYIDGIKPIIDKYFKEKFNSEVETVLPHCFSYQKK